MKKIACFINDSNLLEKVTEFCGLERFQEECIGDPSQFVYDVATVLYLTDDPAALYPEGIKDIRVCYVGKDRPKDCGVFFLPEDFQMIHLRLLIDAVIHNGSFESSLAAVTPVFLNKSFKIKNDIFNVERIVYALTKDFVFFLNFQSLEKVRVGLAEMLTNAIEHGNLGITGEEKMSATESGTYYELVNSRLNDAVCMAKYAVFKFYVDADGLEMSLEDEGEGFDVDSLPDPTDPESLLKLHGRGILITRMYFDEVKYNDKGNHVTLRKRFGCSTC
ncbi:ATP-binding protein [Seleniivibrio woodruffii]|uniref:Anti-sigma regulatory factor (Ser/Thr protein kinase) n=1 Tax=Seleniivibrio woodruffii TaxID=1078050 RepID=A0A4R1KD59_9BACT|nr:ATP-binding protein [Seleniivibrio woodruffii]TCK62515.1 anti-sigma regulatory factor (Ser/Thr protein kinase) [Seleniivibrio woodruffii]TVZ37058.1 anti-sigma regulatory factor (Ser/Thr protein kinase) [Seleniivibrio woodruffii]